MKNFLIGLLLCSIVFSLSACSIPNERTSQTQISQYIEYASSFIDKQNTLNHQFDLFFNDEKNREQAEDFLKHSYIPAFVSFQKEAKSIYLPNPEIKDIHTLYIRIINKQIAAYRLHLSALENQDKNSFQEANEEIKENNELMKSYKKRLQSLAKKHHLTLMEVSS